MRKRPLSLSTVAFSLQYLIDQLYENLLFFFVDKIGLQDPCEYIDCVNSLYLFWRYQTTTSTILICKVDILATLPVQAGMFKTSFRNAIEMLPIRSIKLMFQVVRRIKIESPLVMCQTSLQIENSDSISRVCIHLVGKKCTF